MSLVSNACRKNLCNLLKTAPTAYPQLPPTRGATIPAPHCPTSPPHQTFSAFAVIPFLSLLWVLETFCHTLAVAHLLLVLKRAGLSSSLSLFSRMPDVRDPTRSGRDETLTVCLTVAMARRLYTRLQKCCTLGGVSACGVSGYDESGR